jgi:(E)-4-hydroxy-3-methylbut-2-enyl-diphosphate synthase
MDVHVPLIGDFHYNGHRLLTDYPECAKALSKYRINPGNVGKGDKHDKQFGQMIEAAIRYDKAVRIGVNWGSMDQELLAELMDANAKRPQPFEAKQVMYEALITSAVDSAKLAEEMGMAPRANSAQLQGQWRARSDRGLPRAGQALQLRFALGFDRSRHGRRGAPWPLPRLCRSFARRHWRHHPRLAHAHNPASHVPKRWSSRLKFCKPWACAAFVPSVTACPGCGRTTSTTFQELAKSDRRLTCAHKCRSGQPNTLAWKGLKVAVMGCIVNGPGESKHADIGISLPGSGEAPAAPVFIDGEKAMTLRGEHIAQEFHQIVENYIEKRFG